MGGAIEDYFKLELGRPEILNRIGENIVVFDFIRPETAEAILDSQIDRIKASLRQDKQIELQLSQQAHDTLLKGALSNLDNGGRGIGNMVESLLIDPLARYLFDNGIKKNGRVRITAIDEKSKEILAVHEGLK